MTRGRGLVVVVGNEDVLLGVGGEYWNRTIPKMEKIEVRFAVYFWMFADTLIVAGSSGAHGRGVVAL